MFFNLFIKILKKILGCNIFFLNFEPKMNNRSIFTRFYFGYYFFKNGTGVFC
ncbi:MAG: hypothetical protein RL172_162 [Bacteroidota bacterium]|jgi:hypothetical protein